MLSAIFGSQWIGVDSMSLKDPRKNSRLPLAVQKRLNAMFARDTGFSGPELLEFFSQYSNDVEAYPAGGGAPSRWQILEDCLAEYDRDTQRTIVAELLDYEGPMKYGPPPAEDIAWMRAWLKDGGAPVKPLLPAPAPATKSPTKVLPLSKGKSYDCFLSHASEDKDAIARPLYEALTKAGVSVWFDEATLELGDSLGRKIDEGLAMCRFGIVVLSHAFFAKEWPQRELDGLVAKETASGEKAILPIWHNLTFAEVAKYSPTLAGRLAGRSSDGIDSLVKQILRVVKKP